MFIIYILHDKKCIYFVYKKNNIFYEGEQGKKKSISMKNIFCFVKNKNVKSLTFL